MMEPAFEKRRGQHPALNFAMVNQVEDNETRKIRVSLTRGVSTERMTVTILEEDRLTALALSSPPVTFESAFPISSKNASGFPSVSRRCLRSAPSSLARPTQ